MTKKNKILLGVGLLGVSALFLLKSKKFTNFSSSEYDTCMKSKNDVSACCQAVGGVLSMDKSKCSDQQTITNYNTEKCASTGGVWNTKTNTCDPKSSPKAESNTNSSSNISTSTHENPPLRTTNSSVPTNILNQDSLTLESGLPLDSGYGGELGGEVGGGGGGESIVEENIFDWIPYIITGTTLTLSYIQEKV